MARARSEGGGQRVAVTVALHGAEQGEEQPQLAAYAFTAGGELVGEAALDGGRAQLPLPQSKETQSIRVLVGPAPANDAKPSLAELVRQGAHETHLRVDAGAKLGPIDAAIDSSIWRCWLDYCFVKGTLLKRVVRDGVWIDLPVCNATVDIWEVDPVEVVLPKVPIDVFDRLRGLVVKGPPIPDPPPWERFGGAFPPVGPGPDPAPFVALSAAGGSNAVAEVRAEDAHASALAGAVRSLGAEPAVHAAALSGAQAFRDALIERPDLVRPLLCILFPRVVTTRLIGQAETDDCGHFSTWVWRGCRELDLYFTAWQWRFGGFDPVPMQVLRPTPISCWTWWNYQCGTEVTLYATNPFAQTCAPCPPVIGDPRWVLAMAVGNWPISRIHGLSSSTPADGTNNGLTDGGAPFGGDMRLRLEFDDALAGIGVRYYQVSWRPFGSSATPEPLSGDVHRHYAHEVAGNLVVDVYTLGPKTVGTQWPLYEIPPALPPLGKWSYPDAVQDLTSATFPSTASFAAPQSGLIELHVDLFDGAGNPVNIGALGINYVVPTSTDFSGTIFTENAAADGLVDGNTLVLPLYVDNNITSAVIDAPTLNGSPASDDCGVLEYTDENTDQVAIAYHAHHPHGFATYSFALYRGVTELVPPSQSGAIGGGDFSDTESAGTLLGDCTIAGFSENLAVWATAIDGWRRLSEYDRYAVRAFVLAPQQPEQQA